MLGAFQDPAVVNKLLSMKNSDVHRLLQAFENANEADDGIDVQIQGDGGADANGAAALLGDERPVINLIDRRNSASFARLFSMKNMDFKALLESQGLDPMLPEPAAPPPAAAHAQAPQQPPGAAGAAGGAQQDAGYSKMRSGDLLDWIWTLDEDNLDALLNDKSLVPGAQQQALQMQQTQQAGGTGPGATDYSGVNRLFSQEPMAPPPPFPGAAGAQTAGIKRKASDLYGTGIGGSEPLATNQVAMMLQHQAFLAQRQEQQQQQPAFAKVQARKESIGTKTALGLFEELLEDQQKQMTRRDSHAGTTLSGAPSDGLVGSLAAALGNKKHSSLYVKKAATSEGPSGSMATGDTGGTGGVSRRKPRKPRKGSDDETDPALRAEQEKRRERRAKNKESAAKSRAKKKNYTEGLEGLVENLVATMESQASSEGGEVS